jgi:hypothetical protein
MIDLMNNGLNGSNGKDDDSFIPCPACSQLEEIKQLIAEYQTFQSENPAITIDLMLSELKMWRAKDSYERKLKTTMIGGMVKKLQDNGFQVDGEI